MTAFITRDLTGDSPFETLLAARGWQVEGRSLVELSPLPFREVPPADWIFFSSKNAVRFFFEALTSGGDSKSPPVSARPDSPDDSRSPGEYLRVKWAALGPATAQVLAEYVGKVDFVGTGEPVSTAAKFAPPSGPLPSGEGPGAGSHILFPAARHSRQSVMSLLAGHSTCVHFEIYDNRPVADPPHSQADVLVFTSPMNAQAYLAHHKTAENQRVVAIGETTAQALRELDIAEVYVSEEASEEGLARTVLGLWG